MPFTMSWLVIISVILVMAPKANSQVALREKRSDDHQVMDVVNQLSQQVTSLMAEMTALKAKTAILDQAVAFHAWGTTNPVQATPHGLIVLDHVATNIGNAYSALTGIFTVPVAGLYDFHVSIMTPQSDNYTHATLYIDNSVRAIALSDSRHNYYAQTSTSAVVHVNAGQKVYLKNVDPFASNYYSLASQPYTTFSGFLIKAD